MATIKLTQEEALKRIATILEGTPYQLVQPFVYESDRKTRIKLHCTLHNETWEISWHSFIYDTPKLKQFSGCSGCRQKYSRKRCEEVALLCTKRSEFAFNYKGEYFKALRMGWLDEICAHMDVVGNHYKRCIYAYIFEYNEKKYIYVGLTGNLIKRDKEHRARLQSTINKFSKKYNLPIPPIQQLTDYLTKEEAAIQEGLILEEYMEKGFIPINIKKTGGLGGHLQNDGYTFEECKTVAAQYTKRSEWKKYDYPTYYFASKLGWIDTIKPQDKPYGNRQIRYWTLEKCCELAKECASVADFRKKSPSAYTIVCRMKWNKIVFSGLKRLFEKHNFNLEIITETLKQYTSTADFVKENPSMFNWLGKHKIKLSSIATPEQLHRSRVSGTKSIVQCDLEGNFIAEYNSAREAIGFDYKKISACCHGKNKSHKGYKWFFKKDYKQL